MDTRAARNAWLIRTSSFRQPTVLQKTRLHLGPSQYTGVAKVPSPSYPHNILFGWIQKKFQLYLASTAIPKGLHDGVNLLLKDLCEFAAELVDPGCLPIVKPGVVEHEPDVVYILPGLLVLPCIQLPLDGGKVHGILHNVKVILKDKRLSV